LQPRFGMNNAFVSKCFRFALYVVCTFKLQNMYKSIKTLFEFKPKIPYETARAKVLLEELKYTVNIFTTIVSLSVQRLRTCVRNMSALHYDTFKNENVKNIKYIEMFVLINNSN